MLPKYLNPLSSTDISDHTDEFITVLKNCTEKYTEGKLTASDLLTLGRYYLNGKGTPKSPELCFACSVEACKLDENNANAQYNLGWLYANGVGTENPDYNLAFKCFLASNKINPTDHANLNRLGLCYLHGHGIAQNHQEAFQYFLRAARNSKNTPNPWLNLGDCFANGTGTTQNNDYAIACYKKCLSMNCAFEDVWHSLVRLYHQLQHNALEKICQDNICKIQNKITITLNNEFALNVVETALLIQIQKQKNQITEKESSIIDQATQIATQTKQINALELDISSKEELISTQMAIIAEQKEHSDLANHRIQTLEGSLVAKDHQITSLATAQAEKQLQITTLTSEIAQANEHRSKQNDDIEQLKQQITKHEATIEALSQHHSTQEATIQALNQQIATQTAEIAEKQQILDTAGVRLEGMQQDIFTVAMQFDLLVQKMATQEADINAKAKKIATQEANIKSMNEKMALLEAEVKAKNQIIATQEHSILIKNQDVSTQQFQLKTLHQHVIAQATDIGKKEAQITKLIAQVKETKELNDELNDIIRYQGQRIENLIAKEQAEQEAFASNIPDFILNFGSEFPPNTLNIQPNTLVSFNHPQFENNNNNNQNNNNNNNHCSELIDKADALKHVKEPELDVESLHTLLKPFKTYTPIHDNPVHGAPINSEENISHSETAAFTANHSASRELNKVI